MDTFLTLPIHVITAAARGDDEAVVAGCRTATAEEWASVMSLSLEHRVHGMLVNALVTASSRLPGWITSTAREMLRHLRTSDAIRASAYQAVQRELRGAGVRAVTMKGSAHATLLYPETYCRPYLDLDLLVADEDREAARHVLHRQGFEQAEWGEQAETLTPFTEARLQGYADELQHEAEFVRVDRNVRSALAVDLHFRVSTVFDHRALSPEVLIASSVDHDEFWTLAPADAFCHAAHHAWWDTQSLDNVLNHTDLRMSHFADMLRMLRRWDLTAEQVLGRARELGGEPTANWALYCLHRLFNEVRDIESVDAADAADVDTAFADRWVQRNTAVPMFRWAQPSRERMFRADRGAEASTAFWTEYVAPRLHRGDVLTWVNRG